MTYRNIVVGTDGSTTAELAVRDGSRMAAAHQARLIVVTAYTLDIDPLVGPDDLSSTLTDRAQAEDIARRGRDLAADQGAADVIVHADEGSPVDVLLDAAEEFDADLIVVGSDGLSSPARFVLGSVASSVSHHAPCDVLIVKTSG